MNTRLADFIRAEMDPILQDWDVFAKSLFHDGHIRHTELRDHAQDMLLEIAGDLDTYQSKSEQVNKSKGQGPEDGQESSADMHGADRQTSGFSVKDTVSEFRALRASVVSLWTKAYPVVTGQQFEDLTRFHEAIDQSLAESLKSYSDLKEMETRLFGAILVASPDPICVLDIQGRFRYANKATTDLFTLDHKAIIGKTLLDLRFAFASDLQRNLEKVTADQSVHRGKFSHTFDSGQGERFEYLLAPVLDEHRNTEATVCIIRNVTEQAVAEDKLWHHAHHDHLTGLPNRRLFFDRLEQEVNHAERSSLPFALLCLDLDGFKKVNDSLGHKVGDCLLSDVAKRLTNCVRQEDTVARMGGDEFAVILTGAKQRQEIGRVAQAITDAIAMPFPIAQPPVQISVGTGISLYPQDGSSPSALLEAADQAMYRAKELGLNQISFSAASGFSVGTPNR